ncbi:hypothetical protein [Clostridium folliculivorans]|uniref:Uncharacterized protein n=1 Tax=Clostridium folliculivorans TaxID=2886038 RepID=A0A9W6DDJ2_9CLOT|nr:hypothetical protein [Clostridium folliculivorans]GKU27543.1 hypothetical protein CFOLD11_43700 [Clostridium folliculivorans]GKU32490.1 hypothetical protein CFB3_45980 [Clostridium folliculivorans]
MSEQLELNDLRIWCSVNKLYCPNVVSYTVLATPLEKIILILCVSSLKHWMNNHLI